MIPFGPAETPRRWNARKAVVAGTDAERHTAAIDWAAEEAESTGRPLVLLAVYDDFSLPIPRRSVNSDDDALWRNLLDVAGDVARSRPNLSVRREASLGPTVRGLVDRSSDEALVVVGKRGLGAVGRLTLGSTSIGIAGRSHVPVVVVPNDWRAKAHPNEPVVVGLQPGGPNDSVLKFGFAEASRRGVGLLALAAIDTFSRSAAGHESPSPEEQDVATDHQGVLEDEVARYRDKYPDVTTDLHQTLGEPTRVLLEHARTTQLLVLGRPPSTGYVGFRMGSVARTLVRDATAPVAVVPTL